MPPGKWWDRPEMVKNLGISADQRKKMDDVFQQMRAKLIDLHAALDKEEAAAEPLMQAAQLDDSKILPQIDRIAQARAELEKAEARLVLGLRHVMTVEQWEMLQQSERRPPERGRE
jgi:Spy/CpxP family protein refolding chaperone